MGQNCSSSTVSAATCGVVPARSALSNEDESCGLCSEDKGPVPLTGPHPLLDVDLTPTSRTPPRTPRGPAPPWAAPAFLDEKVDLTATGPTPPRSPTPPRATPPGLPDEEPLCQDVLNGASLASTFDESFLQDLFAATRSGKCSVLSSMMHQVNGGALTLAAAACGPDTKSGQSAVERRERAADMVAAFLSQARAPGSGSRETLLGAAAFGGHLEAVQLLLSSRADPTVVDAHGCSALHRAAEGGRLLTVLMVLDRLQATARAISVADLTNADGETPEMLAALGGASDLCRGFEVFGDLQSDAELRQLGSSSTSPDLAEGQANCSSGNLLAFLDFSADTCSSAGLATSALLRGIGVGSGLVRDLFLRIPDEPSEIAQLVERVCSGVRTAEDILLGTKWNPADPGLHPALRAFVCTAEVRSAWQNLRTEAVQTEAMPGLEDFWQTHLPADIMCSTLMNARGDTFQLLLTVLWLYTREAWLRHVMDTLAGALAAAGCPTVTAVDSAAEGATGSAPTWTPEVPACLRPLAPMVEALSPLMQLVQSSLGWFEESGIRHSGVTYRPLSLPMLRLQRIVDRYVATKKEGETEEDQRGSDKCLTDGAWVSLGAGAFFSTTSSREEALRRLARTRCNVLLLIRPDDRNACFPKQMSLRGTSVDDVIFPLGVVFRITRIHTRVQSSDLHPEACRSSRDREGRSPWPVMIMELSAANRSLEIFELLEKRGDLAAGELERRLHEWINGAMPNDRHERLLQAGELLGRCTAVRGDAGVSHGGSGDSGYVGSSGGRGSRAEKAMELLTDAAREAELSGQSPVEVCTCVARSLLALARCRIVAGLVIAEETIPDGNRAISMLTKVNGANHPETCAARNAWKELGVKIHA